MKGTWQTTGTGGGSIGVAVAAIAVAVVAVPVINALARLAEVLVIVSGAVAALAVLAAAAVAVHRLRHLSATSRPQRGNLPHRSVAADRALLGPRRAAIEAPKQELHIHHHWHGVTAEDVAEIIARQGGE